MATGAEWATAYARQADADFKTFESIQSLSIPQCHILLFLQMACEKLVKAHLCEKGSDPASLQSSHGYVAKNLPNVLRQQAEYVNLPGSKTREMLNHARHLAYEIDVLAPAVRRGGQRPDNCEYPWEDDGETLHLPLDWSFAPSHLIVIPAGRTILKLIRGAIQQIS